MQKTLVDSEFIFSDKFSGLIVKSAKEKPPLQNVWVNDLLNLKLDFKFPFLKLIFLFPKIYSEFSRSNPLENKPSSKNSCFGFLLNLISRWPFPSKFDFTFAIISLSLDL